ncbi:DUF2637 domain-containing protein [Kitasatospora sp. NPDC007106]|uniref:DUF2637 domain-containing protein n=1 Tax=Kitasatospora sp. NPDC007106 TaxID=3156914 RepID=UPI0033C98D9E
MKTTPARWLTGAAAAVIVALTGAAFWLSYAHLHTVAAEHGLGASPARAWAWPATLDLFIVAGELLMLRASLARSTDWWAVGLTVVGSGGSIALNIAGVTGTDPLDYVTAAVPPTAALLAFGALMRQVHGALTAAEQPAEVSLAAVEEPVPDLLDVVDGSVYPEPVPAPYPVDKERVRLDFLPLPQWAPAVVEEPARPRPVLAAEQPRTRTEVHVEYVPEDEPEAGTGDAEAELLARGRERFADQVADRKVPSIREIRAALGVGQPRAQRLQDALRADVEQGVTV